jgi:hypothetical protein
MRLRRPRPPRKGLTRRSRRAGWRRHSGWQIGDGMLDGFTTGTMELWPRRAMRCLRLRLVSFTKARFAVSHPPDVITDPMIIAEPPTGLADRGRLYGLSVVGGAFGYWIVAEICWTRRATGARILRRPSFDKTRPPQAQAAHSASRPTPWSSRKAVSACVSDLPAAVPAPPARRLRLVKPCAGPRSFRSLMGCASAKRMRVAELVDGRIPKSVLETDVSVRADARTISAVAGRARSRQTHNRLSSGSPNGPLRWQGDEYSEARVSDNGPHGRVLRF